MSLKVSLLVWRLLSNLIPTKDKLIHCGIIPHTSSLCSSGCGHDEGVDHLFMGNAYYCIIWMQIRLWLGIFTANKLPISAQLNQLQI